MRRIAAHYVYWRQFCRMHYVELDDEGRLTGVFPLDGEIAGTEFYDGTLLLLPENTEISDSELLADHMKWLNLNETIKPGTRVWVYRLSGITLSASEFGADNGCGDGHIERL